MNLSDLNNELLTAIVTYGAFALGVVVLLAALGLPLPSTFFVLAGGAFVQQGVLDMPTTIVIVLAFVVLGDTLSYALGRVLRGPIVRRFGQSGAWLRAETYFNRRGALAIYLTRWLITPIAVPVNLVAGTSGYDAPRFVGFAAAGELTWLIGYGALGYLFGSQWEYVSDFISNFSGLFVGLLILGGGVIWLLRRPRRAGRAEPAAPLAEQVTRDAP